MTEQTVRIPHFKNKEEFLDWWEGADIKHLRRTNPDVADFLHKHPLVLPWLEKLKSAAGASRASEAINKTFGKYLIERKLGQGGMGAVYLARDTELDRKVAIKIITSDDQEMVERFQREAQAVAKLKHPNIVQVYESGTIDKQHYFTMDYIQGLSLDRVLNSRKLPYDTVARIIVQVALALHYAHRHDIIHRDIKPGNILIDVRGKIYLTDFGLAKQLTGLDRSLTVTGSTVGTPDYMSPEQAQGKKEMINHLSDIFSLGATLFHCLTGQLPFPGEELFDVLSKVVHNETPLPSRIDQNVPKDLETICLKCMEKDQSRRYQNMQELALDIRHYLKGEPITARRASAITRLWFKVKRNKAVSLSVAAVVLILIGLAAWQMVVSYQAARKADAYYLEARELYNQGKYDDARAMCEKIMEITTYHLGADDLKDMCVSKLREKERTVTAKEARLDLRAQAKMVLDRISTGPSTPDSIINIALEALKIDPSFGEAYQTLAYAYKNKEDYDTAYKYFTKAIETSPALAYSYYERGIITAYIQHKPEQAAPDFEKVLRYDPESYIGYFAKGNIESSRKEYDQAIKDYSRAIELYPRCEQAYYERGIAYFYKGDLTQTVKDHAIAIGFNKKYAKISADILSFLPGAAEKITYYTGLISLNPDVAELYLCRGFIYDGNNDTDNAIADYTEAIRFGTKDADAYIGRGRLYSQKNETDRTLSDYAEAIKLDPQNIQALYNRGCIYGEKAEHTTGGLEQAFWDKAIADYTEAIRVSELLYENDTYTSRRLSEIYDNRSRAYLAMGMFEQAIADCTKVIKLNPDDSIGYANRGRAYSKQGLPDRAIADYTQAIKLNPQYIMAYSGRSIAYLGKGDWDNTIADCTSIIGLEPNYFEAYHNRAKAYSEKGNFKEAIADGEMFIKLAQNDPAEKDYLWNMRISVNMWKKQLEKQQGK